MSANNVLRVDNLSVYYDERIALENISFEVEAGESIAIIGPNGAGKSSLMQAIMGLIPVQANCQIHVDRQHLAYVPQHQSIDWSFPINVEEVVLMGLTRQLGWFKRADSQARQRVQVALERVGLAQFRKRPIADLSGGQKQRVFIARALAQAADILLLDEPFAAVDVAVQKDLMQVVDDLHQMGITILVSTHDLNLAFERFQRVMALNRHLVCFDSPTVVYQPKILRELYGGSVALMRETDEVMLLVDEHGQCEHSDS